MSGVERPVSAARLVRLERARPAVVARSEVVVPALRFAIEVSATFDEAPVYDNTAVVEGDSPLEALIEAAEATTAHFAADSGLACHRVRRTVNGLASATKDGAKFTLNQATLARD